MSRLSPPTRALLGLTLASFGVALALAVVSERSVVDEWQRFASGAQGVDSWRPMNQASLYLRDDPEKPLYQWLFFEQKVKFIYPPTSLLFVDGLRALVPEGALQRALNFVSWWLVDRLLLRADLGPRDGLDRGLRLALVFALTLGFYPVVKAYTLGQMQVVVNAAFAGFAVCWASGRRAGAGALAVVMAAVKPQYGALLLWGLVRREWGFVRGALLAGVPLLLVSLALYGVASHLDYLSVAAHVGRLGEAYWPNQTLNGLLQRALGNGNAAAWDHTCIRPTTRASTRRRGSARSSRSASPAWDARVRPVTCSTSRRSCSPPPSRRPSPGSTTTACCRRSSR